MPTSFAERSFLRPSEAIPSLGCSCGPSFRKGAHPYPVIAEADRKRDWGRSMFAAARRTMTPGTRNGRHLESDGGQP